MTIHDDDDATVDPELARLLADPSLWLESDATWVDETEDALVDAIRAERDVVRPLGVPTRRRRWLTSAVAAAAGAAAAALIAVVVVRSGDTDTPVADTTIAVAGTDLAAGITGTAAITTERSGVSVWMWVPGLPRREGDEFYQGWLKSCDGERLVPIGTFHELDRTIGWAGVSIDDFPLLSVTREVVAGPKDAAQGSSGEVVVSGIIGSCPDS